MWLVTEEREAGKGGLKGKVLQAKKQQDDSDDITNPQAEQKGTKKKYISTISVFLPLIHYHSLSPCPPPPHLVPSH